MKIIVGIKRVIDYTVKIRIKADASGVETNNVKMSINPFDEIAVEEAIRLKEKHPEAEVIVVSIGPTSVQETIRHALALGADRGIHVDTPAAPLPLTVAKVLKAVVDNETPHILLLGKQAIDDDCNQVAQMASALLNWPQATFVSHISLEGQTCRAIREVDGGLETLSFPLPAVISTDLRLNTPRYATLPNIMKSKQKPLQVLTLSDLGIEESPHFKVLKVSEPPARKAGAKITVEELVPYIKKVQAEG
ncbi:MAG: electron transfer flavoprotein subunit beta/FixA family protein [Alphaproteobacteria bacterium]|nr:electron transfer flavoprotein subunit beta/FixA family protein [Alphaproteobacteria bacterium]